MKTDFKTLAVLPVFAHTAKGQIWHHTSNFSQFLKRYENAKPCTKVMLKAENNFDGKTNAVLDSSSSDNFPKQRCVVLEYWKLDI